MTHQEKFEKFDRENPQVYDALRTLALRAAREGRKRIGIKQLFEVARWELSFTTHGDKFKLNNNFHSRYARKLMREPELSDIFETRRLQV